MSSSAPDLPGNPQLSRDPAPLSAGLGFASQPQGLRSLYFTELWERFSYYGMRALLVLFMVAPLTDGGLAFSNADAAVNYGGIGAVIGHELSHHFDDQGAKYDSGGKLVTWWTPADTKAFQARLDKLEQQYNAYEPFPGVHVNGKLTMGENVADLAGLTIAHDAYIASLGGKPAPVIDGMTGDQRFYLGWAQVWRRNYREANLRQRLLTDPHSPSAQRTDIVRNMDPWYPAFGVEAGQSLFLTPEQRVRIW